MATVLERVRKIIAEDLSVEESIEPESRLVEDLGADSLGLVELIMHLEEEFSTPEKELTISDEEAQGIITVQGIIDCLESKGIKDEEGG